MASQPGSFNVQEFADAGVPLVGGRLYTYAFGTTTQKDAFTDAAGLVAQTYTSDGAGGQYIALNSRGELPAPLYLASGSYDLALKRADGSSVWTRRADGVALGSDLSAVAGAGLLGFSHSSTYAAGTVGAALQQFVSVKDAPYSAVGDGSTDDTSAIQAALDTSLNVIIPPGTYKLSASLVLRSNTLLRGAGPSSVLKAAADGILVISGPDISNVTVQDLAIDGGGQVGTIYLGAKAVFGVACSGWQNFRLERLQISNCGVALATSVTADAATAGCGILISSSATRGATDGVIYGCKVSNIAGGGNNNGDGIAIAGAFSGSAGRITQRISVIGCEVSLCARHAYSVAGVSAQGLPAHVHFTDCDAANTGLSGIDFEDATYCSVKGGSFMACGNDQTYYNPAVAYGATYRLMAGIATGNFCLSLSFGEVKFSGCYYTINYGATNGLTLCGLTADTAVKSDLAAGLAASPKNLAASDCVFGSANGPSIIGLGNTAPASFANCVFTAGVQFAGAAVDHTFTACTFAKGVAVNGGGVDRHKFIGCVWTDFAGEAVSVLATGDGCADWLFEGCKFNGAGNLTNGISLTFNTGSRWQIINCQFSGLTGAGVTHANSNGASPFAQVVNCKFVSCADGVLLSQNGHVNGQFSGNYFESITGWCLDFNNISSGTTFNQNAVIGNIAGPSCANGLRIVVTTGAWDFSVVEGNNWHNTTTKTSISAGNASGVSANNITV